MNQKLAKGLRKLMREHGKDPKGKDKALYESLKQQAASPAFKQKPVLDMTK